MCNGHQPNADVLNISVWGLTLRQFITGFKQTVLNIGLFPACTVSYTLTAMENIHGGIRDGFFHGGEYIAGAEAHTNYTFPPLTVSYTYVLDR